MKNATFRSSQILLAVGLACLLLPATFAQSAKTKSKSATQPAAQQPQPATQGQTTAGPAAAPASLCGNQPLCYEANDFVATVSEFRVSNDPRGYKIIDAMVHFQNKTTQPISLGYVDGSGSAIDDQGNRLILNTYNGGVRGMGVVAGNNMDPKFTLSPSGGSDARFELYWAPGGRLAGVNYEMDFSIREMNRVEGNQWTLGDETLIHYQGLANGQGVALVSVPAGSNPAGGTGTLANGTTGTAPNTMGTTVNSYTGGQTPAATQPVAYNANVQPCAPASTSSVAQAQNAANSAGVQNQTANNAVNNAASAINNISSMFHKKPKQPAASPAQATPCVATANSVSGNAVAPAANSAAPTPAVATSTTARPAATTNAAPATRVATTPATTATRAQTTTAPKPTVTNAALKQPLPAAKAGIKPSVPKTPTMTTAPAKKPATPTTSTTTGS